MTYVESRFLPAHRTTPLHADERCNGMGGTRTSRGWIPHLAWRGLRCPVKLATVRTHRGPVLAECPEGRPHPLMRHGSYVFALPGGYSVSRDQVRHG